MTGTDAIRKAFDSGEQGIKFIDEMKLSPLHRPGPFGGNHAMWIVGHLTIAEGRLHKMLFGEPNPVEHWKPLFDWGSEPKDDLSAYPPFEEVLATFKKLRAHTRQYLDKLTDADLDQPTKSQPPGLERGFDTVGKAILTIALHAIFHNGEAAVTRRSSGKSPAFVPTDALKAY